MGCGESRSADTKSCSINTAPYPASAKTRGKVVSTTPPVAACEPMHIPMPDFPQSSPTPHHEFPTEQQRPFTSTTVAAAAESPVVVGVSIGAQGSLKESGRMASDTPKATTTSDSGLWSTKYGVAVVAALPTVMSEPREKRPWHPSELLPSSAVSSVLHTRCGGKHRGDKGISPYLGPGPQMKLTMDNVHRCFSEGNGLLFRLVNEKHHFWAFYNDTAEYTIYVSGSFGPGSHVTPLGDARQVVQDRETGACRLEICVEPGCTEPFMQGEYNGFLACYVAQPVHLQKQW